MLHVDKKDKYRPHAKDVLLHIDILSLALKAADLCTVNVVQHYRESTTAHVNRMCVYFRLEDKDSLDIHDNPPIPENVVKEDDNTVCINALL